MRYMAYRTDHVHVAIVGKITVKLDLPCCLTPFQKLVNLKRDLNTMVTNIQIVAEARQVQWRTEIDNARRIRFYKEKKKKDIYMFLLSLGNVKKKRCLLLLC